MKIRITYIILLAFVLLSSSKVFRNHDQPLPTDLYPICPGDSLFYDLFLNSNAPLDSLIDDYLKRRRMAADNIRNEAQVDSFFNINFKRMHFTLDNFMFIRETTVDKSFVWLLSYISGIHCIGVDFAGVCIFDRKTLDEWENWYEKYRKDISTDKIRWGLKALYSDHKTDQTYDSLRRLRVPPLLLEANE